MLALVGVLFGYLESTRQQAENNAAVIQADLLRSDLQNLLRKYLKENPSLSTLQTFYDTPIPIYEETGSFGLTAHCEPLLNRLPLGWLGEEALPDPQQRYHLARKLFDTLAKRAELREPGTLYTMIVAALHGEVSSFAADTRFAKRFAGMSPKTFGYLLDDYRFAADDPNVYRVNWRNYFQLRSFRGKFPNEIDKEFLPAELVAFLYDEALETVKELYVPGHFSEYLAESGAEKKRYSRLFQKKPPLAMHCSILYSFRESQYNVQFDFLGKRIEHFEFQKQ